MRRLAAMLATAGILAATSPCFGVSAWVGVTGVASQYRLDDANDDILFINNALSGNVSEIKSGFGWGGEVGVQLFERVAVAGHFERILARSSVRDSTGSLAFTMDADVIYGTVEWQPAPDRSRVGINVGAGIVRSAAHVDLAILGTDPTSAALDGSGLFVQGGASTRYSMGSRASLVLSGGYRYAKAKSIKVDGSNIQDAFGDGYELDYSGLFAGAEIRVRVL